MKEIKNKLVGDIIITKNQKKIVALKNNKLVLIDYPLKTGF